MDTKVVELMAEGKRWNEAILPLGRRPGLFTLNRNQKEKVKLDVKNKEEAN